MDSNIRIIRSKDVLRGTWSGGTTAEYYSWPEGSSFDRRDFAFSICSATVDLEHSTFTPYEGYDRVILSLSNAFSLTHDGQKSHHLSQYQPHAFTGEALTESFGKYEDLNLLLLRNESCGSMAASIIAPGGLLYGPTGIAGMPRIEAIFCAEGSLDLLFPSNLTLEKGDLVVLEQFPHTDSALIKSSHGGTAVICEVILKGAPLHEAHS